MVAEPVAPAALHTHVIQAHVVERQEAVRLEPDRVAVHGRDAIVGAIPATGLEQPRLDALPDPLDAIVGQGIERQLPFELGGEPSHGLLLATGMSDRRAVPRPVEDVSARALVHSSDAFGRDAADFTPRGLNGRIASTRLPARPAGPPRSRFSSPKQVARPGGAAMFRSACLAVLCAITVFATLVVSVAPAGATPRFRFGARALGARPTPLPQATPGHALGVSDWVKCGVVTTPATTEPVSFQVVHSDGAQGAAIG